MSDDIGRRKYISLLWHMMPNVDRAYFYIGIIISAVFGIRFDEWEWAKQSALLVINIAIFLSGYNVWKSLVEGQEPTLVQESAPGSFNATDWISTGPVTPFYYEIDVNFSSKSKVHTLLRTIIVENAHVDPLLPWNLSADPDMFGPKGEKLTLPVEVMSNQSLVKLLVTATDVDAGLSVFPYQLRDVSEIVIKISYEYSVTGYPIRKKSVDVIVDHSEFKQRAYEYWKSDSITHWAANMVKQ